MKVVKLALSEWINESRDKRELQLCQELGLKAYVVAKGDTTGNIDHVDGFDVYRVSSRPFPKLPNIINRVLSIFTWAKEVRKLEADIISGHDMYAVVIGWLSNIGVPKSSKAKLVYDSHEFELGRNVKRSKFATWCVKQIERFALKKSEFTIVVNDSIADRVQNIYMLTERPVVVRSTPANWELDHDAILQMKFNLLNQLKASEGTFLAMYHGHITENRGLENMLRAIAQTSDTLCVIIGNPSTEVYKNSIDNLINDLDIEDRVLLLDAVPHNELYKYIGAADVSIYVGLGKTESNYLALPNKFFESIQSLTPQIVSNFPELTKLVNEYNIGLTVDPENVENIKSAIECMRDDHEFYASCKENLIKAKNDLSWENEKIFLVEAYKKLIHELTN